MILECKNCNKRDDEEEFYTNEDIEYQVTREDKQVMSDNGLICPCCGTVATLQGFTPESQCEICRDKGWYLVDSIDGNGEYSESRRECDCKGAER